MLAKFSDRLPWPSPPNPLALALAERKKAGSPVLNFVDSNPTRLGLADRPLDFLSPLSGPSSYSYSPEPRGILPAREALAAHLAAKQATRGDRVKALGPEELFLCASTSEAYGWLFKLLCAPGDAVLVPKPGYPLFDYLAGLEAVEARSYRLWYRHPSGWAMDLDSLEAGLAAGRVRAIVLINPNNPTGSYIGAEERSAILGLAARYGAALIVDEVFFDFPLESQGASSFLGEEAVLTFVLDGLSKMLGLPQMKLGWMALSGPGSQVEEAEGRLEIIADTYLSAGTPVMRALPTWLEAAPAFQEALGSRLKLNLAELKRVLEGGASPHRVLRCEGGWTALIESPRLAPEEDIALGLLKEEGLYIHPGFLFDMEREGVFASSLILRPEDLAEGARRYRRYFETLLGT